MTYQLSSFRLANVGDRAARFTDLTLDVSTAGERAPVDSILWLRNGGGKSSLLSLFFALLLPLRKDFMGKTVKRHLEDYVSSGDTSHTVAEWVAQPGGDASRPARLVTGAVYEWDERRKPADPDRDREKLKGWYYSFFAVPGVLDLPGLPVRDESGRTRTMAEFVNVLKEIAAANPQQFRFVITRQRGEWTDALTARNLDPAVFAYQKQMNHSEGGVAGLFEFATTDKFIDFLIDLTVDSTQPDLVANNLRKVVDVLARKPGLLVDREFCGELEGRLERLAERHILAKAAAEAATGARSSAARLAGAFRTAASAREDDRKWLAEEAKRLGDSARALDRERSRVNDIASELYRVAANHRKKTAKAGWERATTTADEANDEDLAWQAVGHLADRVEAHLHAEDVRQQIAQEDRETAPLREARDDAAATLKARYTQLSEEEHEAETMADTAAREAQAEAGTEGFRERQNRKLATEASVRAENARGRLIEIHDEVVAAVRLGDLPDDEADPAIVLAETKQNRREKEDLLGQVRQRREARPAVRAALEAQSRKLATDRAAKTAERDRLNGDRRKLAARVDALATDVRLAELTQLADGTRLDLWAEAADLRAALTREASAAESAVVATRVDAAEDNRALDGLQANDFLPTTRDAERAAEVLVAAGVPATPGWQTLRDLVTEPERASVLENPRVAELAAGVVVADGDAENARRALASKPWYAVAHVAVSTATQFERAVAAAPPAYLVFPSEPALYDRDAAEHARADREERRRDQDRRISELQEQAKADRALLATLESLLEDCPAGHLDALEKAVEECDEAISGLTDDDQVVRAQIDELDEQEAEDAVTEAGLSDELNRLAQRIERLNALAKRTAERPGIQLAIAQLDNEVEVCTGIADEAASRVSELQETEQAARSLASQHQANWKRYERDSTQVTLLDGDREAVVTGDGDPLSWLSSRFAELDSQWQTVASQSVLAERLTAHLERGKRADRALAEYPESARELAQQLLATGDGQDVDRRAAARKRSREVANEAQQKLSEAKTELNQASEEVKQRTPRDRLRHAPLDDEPATEAEARERAAAEAERATEMSSEVTRLNREAEDAGKLASEADTAAQVFAQQAKRLAGATTPVEVPGDVPAYAGDEPEAELESLLSRLQSANKEAEETADRVTRSIAEVRRIAAEARFAEVPGAIRDRLTGDDADVLADRAEDRAQEMRVRYRTIDGQLAEIGRDQRLVVGEIAGLVKDVLATLESAHRHSKLPGTLGRWANEHFLRISFLRPAGDEDLHARIDAVVDRIVADKKTKPEGLAVLKKCVHEAVAPRGFTVKVLKPNSDLAVEPVDVTHLGKFSGGEKLTVCVALYCTLARLRAVNRGRGRAAIGGTLVLDNPLGTASHVALLRLQRDVAAAHGVQLVYTTGVEDLGAVGQFPNVLRMRNAPGSLRNRRYVVLDQQATADDDGITSARVLREDDS
ncbi:hypothetical protein [Amycolatopsis kentuckyensis]|uniref:hypothetical protein n=1 Tax=Amycolatopsis kentuckyensis TaxID=218823 RepID=UPI000A3A5903|nr:hypothetical protein [Amycolatopsis kentuckyensis]